MDELSDGSEDAHRTCPECQGDCEPQPFDVDGMMLIAFVCPTHGVHAVIDPFNEQR